MSSSVDDYDFDLPEALIALRPHEPRDEARLLVYDHGHISDRFVSDLPFCLQSGDLLVFNDSRVMPARLMGVRARADVSAKVDVTLLKRLPSENAAVVRWQAFARPAKRLRLGDRVSFVKDDAVLHADVVAHVGEGLVHLDFYAEDNDFWPLLAKVGDMPLPPYIASKRRPDQRDHIDYQTVYARESGSVAAPTAGLHFTPRLFSALEQRGVGVSYVTLHVGAGTFLPVKSDHLDEHVMHAEWGCVNADVVARIHETKSRGGRVVAVGTTSLRLLESAALDGQLHPWQGETAIFLRPGSSFRVADGLMTNFHLPRSTLLMLVAGFIGYDNTMRLYAHAVERSYRFFSYGDASLLWRHL